MRYSEGGVRIREMRALCRARIREMRASHSLNHWTPPFPLFWTPPLLLQ